MKVEAGETKRYTKRDSVLLLDRGCFVTHISSGEKSQVSSAVGRI